MGHLMTNEGTLVFDKMLTKEQETNVYQILCKAFGDVDIIEGAEFENQNNKTLVEIADSDEYPNSYNSYVIGLILRDDLLPYLEKEGLVVRGTIDWYEYYSRYEFGRIEILDNKVFLRQGIYDYAKGIPL